MTEDQILAYEPRVLSQAQRQFYFDHGYLLVEAVIPDDWVARLRAVTDERVSDNRPK